jgi:hypothetical protein
MGGTARSPLPRKHGGGGLVFVYIGPSGTEPLFPRFDIIDPDRSEDVVLRGVWLWATTPAGSAALSLSDCRKVNAAEKVRRTMCSTLTCGSTRTQRVYLV